MKKTLFALLLGAGSLMGAPVSYLAVVNTGLAPGTLGNIDFQYAPGQVGVSPASTVTISLFTPMAGLNNPVASDGAIGGGNLTTSLAIANSGIFNDYFVGYTFPAQIIFHVTFSGPAIDTPPGSGFGSTFAFAMYDLAGVTPLKSTDPNGNLFTLDVNNNGARTFTPFANGGASVTFTLLPEPRNFVLFPVALAAAALLRRKLE